MSQVTLQRRSSGAASPCQFLHYMLNEAGTSGFAVFLLDWFCISTPFWSSALRRRISRQWSTTPPAATARTGTMTLARVRGLVQ
eukprot:8312545-Pyramimonas_sp.AAC.1